MSDRVFVFLPQGDAMWFNCTTSQLLPSQNEQELTCVPPQAWEEGAVWYGSTYLLAELVGQLAKIAPRLTPSPAWGIKHKPSSDLLMRGSPALL